MGTGLVLAVAVGSTITIRTDPAGSRQRFLNQIAPAPAQDLLEDARKNAFEASPEARAESVALLAEALRRDPANPFRWADLAEMLDELEQLDKAGYCFTQAVQLGPNIPPVLVRAANFHFARRDRSAAMENTRRVLALVPHYDSWVFGAYHRQGIPVTEALSAGLPADKRARQAYTRHLMRTATHKDVALSWELLLKENQADDTIAGQYVQYLLDQRRSAEAASTWAKHLGDRKADYQDPELLYNGGFENELTGSPLDWRVQKLEGVEDDLATGEGYGRGRALRLRFAGVANISYSHVSQHTAVPKGGKYRFSARVRTDRLTTNQGIRFRLYDAESPGRFDIRTEQLVGTNPWTAVQQSIQIPGATRLLVVQVVRDPSSKLDSKIRGTVWIDNVSLLPAS